MKQKYTITVADMEVNVLSEAPAEEVEKIVGVLDRRIRSILLKSQSCSKTEATILCALDFCADKLQMKEAIEVLMSDLEDERSKIAVLEEKVALLENNLEKTERECARLESENKKLSGVEDKPDEQSTETQPTEAQPTESETEKKARSRSRVGGMFDLLTFTDI